MPQTLLIGGFAGVILAGTLLLLLPWSQTKGEVGFVDALFTSTSAVCVTGLVVVDTGTAYTLFGQTVIVGLIQIGGLGVMTLPAWLSSCSAGVYPWLPRRLCLTPFSNVIWAANLPKDSCNLFEGAAGEFGMAGRGGGRVGPSPLARRVKKTLAPIRQIRRILAARLA